MTTRLILRASVAALATLTAGAVQAADMPAAAPLPETCKATITFPAFGGVIKQNPNPACFTTGIGDIYVGGVVTGYAYNSSNPFSTVLAPPFVQPDREYRVDFSNLQGFIQKADGPFQFYVAAGLYTLPSLGLPNYSSFDQTDLLFTPVPIVFGKYVFNDNWSFQGGRMPTLIGSELPFTFQNLNIQRGLLFNQENVINQGVQVNYADGPLSVSVAGTDGFFSGQLSWFTGAVTYKLDDSNTVGINGGLNLDRTNAFARTLRYQFATLPFQQNSGIISANYTYANGPWIVTPYIQFTNVEADPAVGIFGSASTFGGAVLASYAFTDNFALAARGEYIEQSGNARNPGLTPSLLYGPGSQAFSFTITPTFTFDRFFVRGEYSHVELFDIQIGSLAGGTIGSGFGRTGNRRDQDRFLIETGFTF